MMDPVRKEIFKDIDAERRYQNEKWGKAFDANNTLNDWVAYLNMYTGKAIRMDTPNSQVRESMLKVAALAVAAIEQLDTDGIAPRHYDKGKIFA